MEWRIFYFSSTNNLKLRLKLHNERKVKSTKGGRPWKLIWYNAFKTEKGARNFELYLKTGLGKTFACKKLISVALKKDFLSGRKDNPKHKRKTPYLIIQKIYFQ